MNVNISCSNLGVRLGDCPLNVLLEPEGASSIRQQSQQQEIVHHPNAFASAVSCRFEPRHRKVMEAGETRISKGSGSSPSEDNILQMLQNLKFQIITSVHVYQAVHEKHDNVHGICEYILDAVAEDDGA